MSSTLSASTVASSVALAAVLAVRGYRRRSLTWYGSVTAFGVGTAVGCCGLTTTVSLVAFYLSGTFLTKMGKDVKKKIEAHYEAAGHRSAWQVLSNGGAAAALAVYRVAAAPSLPPSMQASLVLAIVAQLAALQGDTWSSELGVLSKSEPRLILGLRRVPRGTNGGVTWTGLLAAVAAGLFSGVLCFVSESVVTRLTAKTPSKPLPFELLTVCIFGAIGGSIIDSVAGQLFQRTLMRRQTGHIGDGTDWNETDGETQYVAGYFNFLSNNGVNFVTSLVVAAATLWLYTE